MAGLPPPSGGAKFADFDLTLTDRELDDFLSFMEHQTTGEYTNTMPQLPDVAADFPGLQLQPHSGSPSRSEGSDSGLAASGGAAATAAGRGGAATAGRAAALAASDGSLTSATMSSPAHEPAAMGSSGTTPQQRGVSASSPLDVSSQQQQRLQQQQQQQHAAAIKLEPPSLLAMGSSQQAVQVQGLPLGMQQYPAACSPLPNMLAASAGSAAAAAGSNTLAGSLGPVGSSSGNTLLPPCPAGLDGMVGGSGGQGGYGLAAMQWHTSPAFAALPASSAATQQQQGQGLEQPMQQLMFMQAPGLQPPQQMQALPQQQQQQLGLLQPAMAPISQQVAAFAGLAGPTAGAPGCSSAAVQMERQPSGAHARGAGRQLLQHHSQQLQQQHRVPSSSLHCEAPGGGGKPQISHSTVEKQRRDRLNSLIDELSDLVPPADPKYSSDTNSVRRPKHVVLADTINLLKAMQTKLQIEEAEICTLKQQAAAVGAIAAQHQAGHAAVPEAADALMQAAAAAGAVSPEHNPAPYGDACGGGAMMGVELPSAPEAGAPHATGVLVEQGIGCLYVKLNCKDRKGLLSDVVSALKAFPVVISTAAITTTRDGNVHDVFEVRIEDASITAEDIQCAVQAALFAAERARKEGKRLRREDSGATLQQR